MEAMAHRIVAEGLSVRAVEELVILSSSEGNQRRSRKRAQHNTPPEIVAELQLLLSERLDTRVSLQGFATARAKGRVVITCADVEDLERILDVLRLRS